VARTFSPPAGSKSNRDVARLTTSTRRAQSNAIYFSRSTDHGATFSAPLKLSSSVQDVQFPDISVASNGHVYITFRQFAVPAPSSSSRSISFPTASSGCGQVRCDERA